ncbi:MAG: CHASE3 domain-containing protein [Vicinamibacteria bacterium]
MKTSPESAGGGVGSAWPLDRKIDVGFSLALGFLILVCLVSYRTTRQLVDTVHRQLHTHRVLDELDDLRSRLQDAETGQRGYLITGEERYLHPYREAIRKGSSNPPRAGRCSWTRSETCR